jgi:energy-coupling factor transporter ATP-binding protein EcfA2
MARHTDAALFAATRPHPSAVARRVVITGTALVLNGMVGNAVFSAALAACGFVALVASRSEREVARATVWIAGAAALSALAAGWSMASATAYLIIARTVAGLAWLLWLGAGLDWPALRAVLERLRVPAEALRVLDRATLHAGLTRRTWSRRRDAARLRLGRARLRVETWAALLAEGAIETIDRVARADLMARVRGAAPDPSGADATSSVELRALGLTSDGTARLTAVDLRVAAGEWLVVAGASGAGKSSLLSVLAGLTPPTRGELSRLDRTITPETPLQHRLDGRVGLLSQNPEHHFIASTVTEDVVWGLVQRGVAPTEAAARATAALAGLRVGHLADRPVETLSFGEQRRVALAGLLVLEPALLLLDEPTAALDPVSAETLIEAVEAAAADSLASCLWVTHDLNRLPARATRVVLLRAGRIVFDGPRETALRSDHLIEAGLSRPEAPPRV